MGGEKGETVNEGKAVDDTVNEDIERGTIVDLREAAADTLKDPTTAQ